MRPRRALPRSWQMEREEREPDEGPQQESAWQEPEAAASSWSAEPADTPAAEETTVTQPDYYAVLGVPPGSGPRAIAGAYDRLSRELQPDTNGPLTDPERMREVD